MTATMFWEYAFMQRALLAALLVGLTAPAVGVFLVQRRLALIGDGLGHVAVTGVALGLVMNRAPVAVALVTAIAGAVAIELIRTQREAFAEIALAVLFYGGIAGGVVLVQQAPSGSRNLTQYLFGSIATTSSGDLVVFSALGAIVVVATTVLRPALFAAGNDEPFARASGLPVRRLNLVIAVLSALTVVVAMRVVGVLLVSALMVIPVATARLFAASFAGTHRLATAIGALGSAAGVVASYYLDTPSGATIVLLVIAAFLASLAATSARQRFASG